MNCVIYNPSSLLIVSIIMRLTSFQNSHQLQPCLTLSKDVDKKQRLVRVVTFDYLFRNHWNLSEDAVGPGAKYSLFRDALLLHIFNLL